MLADATSQKPADATDATPDAAVAATASTATAASTPTTDAADSANTAPTANTANAPAIAPDSNTIRAPAADETNGPLRNSDVLGVALPPDLIESPSPKNILDAEICKDKANALFAEHHYQQAIDMYTEAIKLNPLAPSYYCNRSLAHHRSESYALAETDATYAIMLSPQASKPYFRRAVARMSALNIVGALEDFKILVKREPDDKAIRKTFEECEKIHRRMLFEKAISVPGNKQENIENLLGNPADIVVEESYTGPRCDDGVFTADFAREVGETFMKGGKIHKKYLYMIILASYKLFRAMDTLINVSVPKDGQLTVCGDTHGQFYDFYGIFQQFHYPSPSNVYIFNGDFVDRGSLSLEVIVTLLSWKLALPEHMHLTRGNHETIEMNRMYGFEKEVRTKINQTAFTAFSQLFEALPLAIVIDHKIFVVHGGIPTEDDVTLEDIRQIDRFKQPEPGSIMNQLLWSDPHPGVGKMASKRGAGFQFGRDYTDNFLKRNNLNLIIRSHECREDGYEYLHDGKCLTVFSAPNYCNTVRNLGAVVQIGPDLVEKVKFFSDAVGRTQEKLLNVKSPEDMWTQRAATKNCTSDFSTNA